MKSQLLNKSARVCRRRPRYFVQSERVSRAMIREARGGMRSCQRMVQQDIDHLHCQYITLGTVKSRETALEPRREDSNVRWNTQVLIAKMLGSHVSGTVG